MYVHVERVFPIEEIENGSLDAFLETLQDCETWGEVGVLNDKYEQGAMVVRAKVVLGSRAYNVFHKHGLKQWRLDNE